MNNEDLERLKAILTTLPEDDREFLIRVIYELEVLPSGVEVKIDDLEGDFINHPVVTAIHPDGVEKKIDVFETVNKNALSIGHPLVLQAIQRWEGIVRYHRAMSRKPREPEKHPSKNPRRADRMNYYDIAKRHLENLGRALLKGAEERAVPLETAMGLDLETGFTRPHYGHLHQAWKFMNERGFKYKPHGEGLETLRNDKEKITYIRRRLREEWHAAGVAYDDSGAPEIIAFLQSDEGSSFLYKKRRYKELMNAFDSWRTGLPVSTVKSYKSKAKKAPSEKSDARYLHPDRSSRFVLSCIGNWRYFPTVPPATKESTEE